MTEHILSWITFLPLLGALLLLATPSGRPGLRRGVALGATSLVTVLAAFLWSSFDGASAGAQSVVAHDGFGLPGTYADAVLVRFALGAARGPIEDTPSRFAWRDFYVPGGIRFRCKDSPFAVDLLDRLAVRRILNECGLLQAHYTNGRGFVYKLFSATSLQKRNHIPLRPVKRHARQLKRRVTKFK